MVNSVKALKILFVFFIISTLVSQSAVDFFSVLLCGQWLWLVYSERKAGNGRPLLRAFGLEKVWLAWVFIVLVGFLLNLHRPLYMLERILEFRWIFVLYVLIEVFDYVKPDKRAINFMVWFLGLISAANIGIFFADFPSLGWLRYGSEPGGFVRAGGFFGDPMTFAHSFVLLLLLCCGLVFWSHERFSRSQLLAMSISCGLGVVSIYLTFTRGVWVGFLAGLAFFKFLTRPVLALIVSFVLGLGSWYIYQSLSEGSAIHWRVSRTFKEIDGKSERKVIWRTHYEIFKDFPIFGAGYGQNSHLVPSYYERDGVPTGTLVSHAHNQYLHLAAGTGLLGLCCYLFIWYFFFRNLIRLWRRRDLDLWDRGLVAGLLMGQIAFCVGGLTEANFEHSKVRFMVMLMWAFGIYLANKYGVIVLRGAGRKL